MRESWFRRYVWTVLAFNLGVVLWGAYVRATGSGAGCGGHWPTCHGEIIPRSPATETLVEFTHRLSSGLALLLVVGLVVFAFRTHATGSPVRKAAVVSGALIVVEALLGASLVVFGLTAEDHSPARAIMLSIHQVNTLLLLGAITLTGWWASGGPSFRVRGQGIPGALLFVGLGGVALLAATGAVTALGDTLFPGGALAEGNDLTAPAASHFLLRLRILHPIFAVAAGAYLSVAAIGVAAFRPAPIVRRLAFVLVGLFGLQLASGVVNVILMAPVWMQMVHLLLADLVWISLTLLSAATFAQGKGAEFAVAGAAGLRT